MPQNHTSKFKQIYDALPAKANPAPKTAFVREIAKLTMVNEITVRNWLSGRQQPDALKASIIAKHLNVPVEELF